MDWARSTWFGIRNYWSRIIWQNFNNSRYAKQISKTLKINQTIFGKDIDLDKEVIFDAKGNRITNKYCEEIIEEIYKKEESK